jgi:hypothetical protein
VSQILDAHQLGAADLAVDDDLDGSARLGDEVDAGDRTVAPFPDDLQVTESDLDGRGIPMPVDAAALRDVSLLAADAVAHDHPKGPQDRPRCPLRFPETATLSPQPGTARNETAYVRESGYAERYRDARFRTGSGPRTDRRERRAIAKLLRGIRTSEGPWIDVPCGAGRLSDLLPGPVVQVDRDPAMVRAVQADGTTRICASAHALPFADGTFAGALCMRLFQHLPHGEERVQVLSELRRVTRGPIVLSFFHATSVQHVRRVVSRRLRRKPVSGRSAVTLRRFFAEMSRAGLRPVRCAPLLPFLSDQWVVLAEPIAD